MLCWLLITIVGVDMDRVIIEGGIPVFRRGAACMKADFTLLISVTIIVGRGI